MRHTISPNSYTCDASPETIGYAVVSELAVALGAAAYSFIAVNYSEYLDLGYVAQQCHIPYESLQLALDQLVTNKILQPDPDQQGYYRRGRVTKVCCSGEGYDKHDTSFVVLPPLTEAIAYRGSVLNLASIATQTAFNEFRRTMLARRPRAKQTVSAPKLGAADIPRPKPVNPANGLVGENLTWKQIKSLIILRLILADCQSAEEVERLCRKWQVCVRFLRDGLEELRRAHIYQPPASGKGLGRVNRQVRYVKYRGDGTCDPDWMEEALGLTSGQSYALEELAMFCRAHDPHDGAAQIKWYNHLSPPPEPRRVVRRSQPTFLRSPAASAPVSPPVSTQLRKEAIIPVMTVTEEVMVTPNAGEPGHLVLTKLQLETLLLIRDDLKDGNWHSFPVTETFRKYGLPVTGGGLAPSAVYVHLLPLKKHGAVERRDEEDTAYWRLPDNRLPVEYNTRWRNATEPVKLFDRVEVVPGQVYALDQLAAAFLSTLTTAKYDEPTASAESTVGDGDTAPGWPPSTASSAPKETETEPAAAAVEPPSASTDVHGPTSVTEMPMPAAERNGAEAPGPERRLQLIPLLTAQRDEWQAEAERLKGEAGRLEHEAAAKRATAQRLLDSLPKLDEALSVLA